MSSPIINSIFQAEKEVRCRGVNNIMKRALFSVLVIAAVMFVAGCSNPSDGGNENDAYAIDIGPAGGWVFYDDEADGVDDIAGFRYLEAAPSDISLEVSAPVINFLKTPE